MPAVRRKKGRSLREPNREGGDYDAKGARTASQDAGTTNIDIQEGSLKDLPRRGSGTLFAPRPAKSEPDPEVFQRPQEQYKQH
jgi:hypothetical protein